MVLSVWAGQKDCVGWSHEFIMIKPHTYNKFMYALIGYILYFLYTGH